MKTKLTRKQIGSKGGKATWKKVSKAERRRIMTERANQLWAKIRAGSLSTGSQAK